MKCLFYYILLYSLSQILGSPLIHIKGDLMDVN